jgi:hypothetical protein
MVHPNFASRFFAHIDAQKQSLAIRRHIDATVAAHITFRHDLVDLPLRAHRAVEADLVNVRHVLAKNRLAVARPNRRVTRHFTLHAGLEHVEIRAVGIHHGKIPDFVRTRSEKDLFPVSRPARVVRIIARDIFENVNFSRANIDNAI